MACSGLWGEGFAEPKGRVVVETIEYRERDTLSRNLKAPLPASIGAKAVNEDTSSGWEDDVPIPQVCGCIKDIVGRAIPAAGLIHSMPFARIFLGRNKCKFCCL